MLLPGSQIKYTASPAGGPLRQGEILTELVQIRLALDRIDSEPRDVDEITHPVAIVLSQDCDLAQDYARTERDPDNDRNLPNILFCEAIETETLRGIPGAFSSWKLITRNKDERWQVLEKIPNEHDSAGDGIEALAIDFKRYFTVPTGEVYKRLQLGQVKRRSYLHSPYAAQLATRFFNFQSRIGLPEDHSVEV